jgi:hypothetical protein
MLAGPAAMAEASLNKPETVVFVRRYGSGKSMIAATYFNRIAKERGQCLPRQRHDMVRASLHLGGWDSARR